MPATAPRPPAPQGGLRLDSTDAIRRGGNSGIVIQPGNPDLSLLIRAIRQTDKTLKMPPGSPLPPEVVADFEAWVREGAALPEDRVQAVKKQPVLWSLKKPGLPALPAVQGQQGIRNDVDRFILSRLEAKGLTPAPEADKRTLIRRTTYDLTGLPPSADDIDRFMGDTSADAYEKLIDRLLASPRYGERWGRHWLDLARYADNKGYVFFEGKEYPWAWAYRDYVIRSFNGDRPFDRFVQEQLAADLLCPDDREAQAALGFLTIGGHFMNNTHDIIDDRIDVITRGLMGLTVTCARCHDHKFDPIPSADYYSLYGVLRSSVEPTVPPLAGPPPKEPEHQLFDAELEIRE